MPQQLLLRAVWASQAARGLGEALARGFVPASRLMLHDLRSGL